MTRIMILSGYGFTGRLLARHILEQTNAEITLAGRHLEMARAYAEQLNSEFDGVRGYRPSVPMPRIDRACTRP